MNKTIEYFNEHAEKQFREAFAIKDHAMQDLFLSKVKPGGHILDFGCGSGRDTEYFRSKGFTVEAADGSEEFCRLASEYLKQEVRCMEFSELCAEDAYDGIFAQASIMHLPHDELRALFPKMIRALKKDGILYASFKYGDFEGWSHGRWFTYLTEDTIRALAENLPCEILEVGRSGLENEALYGFSWIYLILKKN